MQNNKLLNRDEMLADVSTELEAKYNSLRVAAMSHYLHERSLTPEQKAFAHDVFFGGVENKQFEEHIEIDSLWLERYAEYRALGLTKAETALMLGITPHRLSSLFDGDGISAKNHKFLLRVEALGDIELKAHVLQVVVDTIKSGTKDSWRAALALMEKRWPEQYGKKMEIAGPVNVRMSAELCEDSAIKARAALERIRESRGESLGIPAEELYVKPEEYFAGPDKRQIELGLTDNA